MEFAGFWKRFGAMWLDTLVLSPIMLIAYFGSNNFRLFDLYYLIPGILFNIWFGVYLVKRFGGTPGKLLMKIKITKLDFSPVEYKEAVLRDIVNIVFATLLTISNIIIVLNMTDSLYFSMEFFERGKYILDSKSSWAGMVSVLFNIWIWSEFIVMLTNKKRRALHDFIAGTVVINTNIPKEKKSS